MRRFKRYIATKYVEKKGNYMLLASQFFNQYRDVLAYIQKGKEPPYGLIIIRGIPLKKTHDEKILFVLV